jgi:opacity protein-like surface antigen
MKRIALTVVSAVAFLLFVAAPAFAQEGSSLANRPQVAGSSGSSGSAGGTAFTGANVSTGLVLLIALVVVGMLAIYLGRRRLSATR